MLTHFLKHTNLTLIDCRIFLFLIFLTRLLQSAGNITTSKITALLEYIFQPISVQFCSSKLDEYCRDSQHFLLNLVNWKNNAELDLNENNLYIVAGDGKSLYPSIPRSLIEKTLTFALTYHSLFTQDVVDNLINLTMFCLHNVIIQHKQNFYTQKIGIIGTIWGALNFCPKNLSLQLNFAQKNFQHIIYGNGIKIPNIGPQMLTAKKLASVVQYCGQFIEK